MLNFASAIETLGQQLLHADADSIGRCQQMYASQWRSAPFPASELDPESFEVLDGDLRFQNAVEQIGGKPSGDNEFLIADWYERVGEVVSGTAPMLTSNTMLVELLSYKGEGVGVMLYEQFHHLPLFVSKDRSATYFNA